MSRRRVALVAAVLFGALGGVAALDRPAFAHAELVSTDPAAGAVLAEAPAAVTLEFSESVEIGLGGVRIFDGSGTEVSVGTARHPSDRASAVEVELPELADGSYVVDWRVVSTDSHPIRGAFSFQVGEVADLQPGVIDEIIGRDRTDRPAGIALAASRALVIAAMAMVFGGLAMLGFDVVVDQRRTRRVVAVSAVAGGVVGLLQLPLEVAYATGRSLGLVFDSSAWSAAFDTRIGVAWAVRAVLIAVVGLGLSRTLDRRAQSWWRFVLGLGLAGIGVASAFSGHGATGRWQSLGLLATVVHVAAMAIWLGGLITIVLSLGTVTGHSMRRFSTVAFAAISAVVASGVVQAVRQVGSIDALTGTNYGRLLIVKVGLVALVVVVAAVSKRVVGRTPLDVERLRRAIGIEVLTAVAIVTATSLLMAANPSQAESDTLFSATLIDGAYLANVTIEPGRVGANELHLYLSNAETSLIEPDTVVVQVSDPSRDVAPIDIVVTRSGASHYTSPDATFPYAASWRLTVQARYNDFDQAEFSTTVTIGQ